MSDALKAAVQQYSLECSSEQPTDQVANLEQAWIDLQIMTPAQAHEVSQELTQQVAKSSTQSNPAALIEASTAIIENSKGAQFSECAVAVTADAIFGVGGGVMGLYGSIIDAHDGKPASSLAKPLEAAGITAFLVAFFGLAMTMSYICH